MHSATVPSVHPPRSATARYGSDELGSHEKRDDGLDPALVRPARSRDRCFRRTSALHVHEEAGRAQVHVAREVDVVDTGALERRRLLFADVRRKEQNSIVRVLLAEFGPPTIELVGDYGGVLMTEVTLLYEEVALRLAAELCAQVSRVEGPSAERQRQARPRNPLARGGPRTVAVGRSARPGMYRN